MLASLVRRLAGAGAACLALAAAPGHGASLQVAPVLVEFAEPVRAQAVWLSNTGTSRLRAQVRVQAWTQAGGTDQLAPTRELVASPPLLELEPGQTQLVRIVRPGPASPAGPDGERSYRLIVDELPGADGSPAQPAAGLSFLFRYLVPVFVGTPPASTGPDGRQAAPVRALSSRLESDGTGYTLAVANAGPRRVKISGLVHVDAQGKRTPVTPGLLGYVLAGQRMAWRLDLSQIQGPPSAGTFKATLDADTDEQVLLAPGARP